MSANAESVAEGGM